MLPQMTDIETNNRGNKGVKMVNAKPGFPLLFCTDQL